MADFTTLLASGQAWLYLPAALLLGALHALEPGHAKSMMAGFIVATRGTPAQAVLLGLSAAIAHSLTVWGLVLVALWLGTTVPDAWLPWLGIAAGGVALLIAAWMAWNIGRLHDHDHAHAHHDAPDHAPVHAHAGAHRHDHARAHGHARAAPSSPALATTGQVIAFGFSGGLMPCPGALAVLALCLSVGAVGLGIAMVAAFSLGLALVLVGVGLAAALTLRFAADRVPALAAWAGRLPWLSAAIVAASGLWTLLHALAKLGA